MQVSVTVLSEGIIVVADPAAGPRPGSAAAMNSGFEACFDFRSLHT